MHEFTQEAGYPVGGDFLIQYYLVQMHYDNPHSTASMKLSLYRLEKTKIPDIHLDRVDSSGIRFYLGNELRQHDLGYLTLGTNSNGLALAIPPKADQFIVDSYCSAKATLVGIYRFSFTSPSL